MVYNSSLNYCTCSPDKIFGYSIRQCCYFHDRDYRSINKDRNSRKVADKNLRECMKKKLPKKLHFMAWFYWFFVRLLGWRYYRGK